MKLRIRKSFGESKVYYSGSMLHIFKVLCQGNKESLSGWFLVRFILIVYLKYKGHGVEIKTAITVDYFKLVTMIFVNDGYFKTLGKITESR